MKYLFAIILLSVAWAATPAFAQQAFCDGVKCTYTPLEQLPGQTNPAIRTVQDFGNYIGAAFRLFIVLGGMFAVATFVFGGIMYMVSDVLDKKDWARRQMMRSVYGLLLLLGSFLILVTVNPNLRTLNFNPESITARSTITTPTGQTYSNVIGTQPTQTQRDECTRQGRAIDYRADGSWTCL